MRQGKKVYILNDQVMRVLPIQCIKPLIGMELQIQARRIMAGGNCPGGKALRIIFYPCLAEHSLFSGTIFPYAFLHQTLLPSCSVSSQFLWNRVKHLWTETAETVRPIINFSFSKIVFVQNFGHSHENLTKSQMLVSNLDYR